MSAGKQPWRGQVAQMPITRRWDPDSLDPREFDRPQDGEGNPAGETFSVVHALRSRYELYAEATSRGTAEPFTISSCPNAVRHSLDQIQARTFQVGVAPGIYALTYCALEHGLQAIGGNGDYGYEEHPVIRAIRDANKALAYADWPNKEIRRVVKDCANAATFTERLLPGGAHRKWSIRLPSECVRDLGGLASDLGVDKQQVAVLCLLVTLSTQEEELSDQREEYARLVVAFLERVQLRADIVSALVDRLSLGRQRRARLRKEAERSEKRRQEKGPTAKEVRKRREEMRRKEWERIEEIRERKLREQEEREEAEG